MDVPHAVDSGVGLEMMEESLGCCSALTVGESTRFGLARLEVSALVLSSALCVLSAGSDQAGRRGKCIHVLFNSMSELEHPPPMPANLASY